MFCVCQAKHEWWWLYVADRKNHLLITAPVQVCSLKDEEQVQLKFSAPAKIGVYQYTVVLRSDSYMDFDQAHSFKVGCAHTVWRGWLISLCQQTRS